MSGSSTDEQGQLHDLIGVGFGPSNLALAIALHERKAHSGHAPAALFLERQPEFGWHRGMLIDDATMQVSFLKDLVTLRNPKSEFSFLSYLHDRDRLIDFINHKTLFPLRAEFHDYLEWAAAQVPELVAYNRYVIAVRPVYDGDLIWAFDVTSRQGAGNTVTDRTRNLVLGVGLVPRLPEGVVASDRIWHNHNLLRHVGRLGEKMPARFVVVGAGQSAAEVTAHLHDRFPDSEVCAVFSRFGYSPADDSPFANRVFDPDAVDEFYSAPEDVKQMILDYHGNTNYSVVDLELIDDLYKRMYRERVSGEERLRCFNVSRITDLAESEVDVTVTVESLSTGQKTVLAADVVVYCTGYSAADPADMLGDIVAHLRRDRFGRLRVNRDYRVVSSCELRAGVYLQGGTEHSHGLTSSLLSNTAVRAGDILASIERGRHPSAVGSG